MHACGWPNELQVVATATSSGYGWRMRPVGVDDGRGAVATATSTDGGTLAAQAAESQRHNEFRVWMEERMQFTGGDHNVVATATSSGYGWR
jgi:hypothetical protein